MAHVAEDLCREHDRLRGLRAVEEPQWREIAAIIKPEDRDIGTRTERVIVADDIFDSTPMQALDQFVGGLFSQATNPADRWVGLALDDKDLAQYGPVKDYLWAFENMFFDSVSPGLSNFYSMIPAVFSDLGAFGLGTLYSDADIDRRRFRDVAVPLNETFLDVDAEGRPIAFHREFKMRGSQRKAYFGDAAPDMRDDREIWIVHSVRPNEDHKPGAFGHRGKPFASTYFSEDLPGWRIDGGYWEMPYHVAPWTLRAGRVYPIGPGHLARADMASLQEMERDHLVAANYAADPPHLLHDKTGLSPADLQPGRVLYGTISDRGEPLVQRYDTGAQLQLSMAQSEQRRSAIREAFMFSIMQLVNRPQMTATEFLGFKEEQLRLLAPNLGRLHSYLLEPFVKRRIRMMQRLGLVPAPPPQLHGQAIKIEFRSPLAKAQLVAQGRASMQVVQSVATLAQMRPEVTDVLDADDIARGWVNSFGAAPSTVRDPDAVAKDRAARAQAQQMAQQLQMAQMASGALADGAHAAQAATLSGQRMPGGAPAQAA